MATAGTLAAQDVTPDITAEPVATESSDSGTDQAANGESLSRADAKRIDTLWVLVSAALVFFMQAGFLMLETGMVRAKNTINVAVKNLFDYVVGFVVFFAAGFALMFGESLGGWTGASKFWLSGVQGADDFAYFLFQVAFLGTAATIVSGAVAERMRFTAYAVVSATISLIIYPLFGHWTWGGGWLAELGFVDFAGSTIVHALGGWVALAGVIVLGPRIDKFGPRGEVRDLVGNNLTQSVLGVFILWLGWFGFNGGSTLEFNDQVPLILLNTSVAASFGGLTAFIVSWILHARPTVEDGMNGVIGGLVAITAGCHAFTPSVSAMLGVVAGCLVVVAVQVMERVFRLDDVIAAFPVHAVCGLWGTLAVGFFASPEHFAVVDGTTLSRAGQIGAQALGSIVCAVWAFGLGLVLFWILRRTIGLRVPPEAEAEGLNISEHGARNSWIDLMDAMERMSHGEGDLRSRLHEEAGTEAGAVAGVFNRVILSLGGIVGQAQKSAGRLRDVAEAFSDSAAEMSTSVEQQSAQMEEIHAIIGSVNGALGEVVHFAGEQGQMTQQVMELSRELESGFKDFSDRTHESGESAAEGNRLAQQGGQELESLQAAMQRITGSTERIEDTVSALERISEQLNMLSLNASIEAARSGESGRGFAVVADEIHRLSDFTAHRTREASASLAEIQKEVRAGNASLENTFGSFRGVSRAITSLDGLLEKLSASGREHSEQAAAIPRLLERLQETAETLLLGVRQRVGEVGEVYNALKQQSAALAQISGQAEELQTASAALHEHSSALTGQVGRFQV
ncbi:MAG: ammonium transporter [bacterium]|nr:ammonium transporter [bacterium]